MTLPDTHPRPARSRRTLVVLILLMVLGGLVRLLATRNDFWLDEILSLVFARNVKSIFQIFTFLHNDSNHYLNTLYIYLLGDHRYWPVYRYFSVACGIAAIPAGYWLLAPRSRRQGLFFAAMLAASYPLIHFSSEARGYSGAVFGALLAAAALVHFLHRPRLLTGALYALAILFGFLSHLTACFIWAPLALWSFLLLLYRNRRSWRALCLALLQWILLNLPPAIVLALLYHYDLRFFYQLGGPPVTLFFAVSRFLALTLGWPAHDPYTPYFLIIPVALLCLWQFRFLLKIRDSFFLLLLLIFLTPAICFFIFPPRYFFPRYLLIEAPFIYLLLTLAITRLHAFPRLRHAPALLLLLFIAAQLSLYHNFLSVGRGQFLAALDYMASHTRSAALDVTSNEDMRADVEFPFYARYLPPGRSINYIPQADQDFIHADWFIMHREGYEQPGPPSFTLGTEPPWYRRAFFPASELSGQAWTLYTHIPPPLPKTK